MNNFLMKKKVLAPFLEMLRQAGKDILSVYGDCAAVEQKADKSPVTAADKLSHCRIISYLAAHSSFPILSEEGMDIPYEERKHWNIFWLVDPLDGTKEFINRNGEFTVNVALIQGRKPVFGAIYLPVKDVFYYAEKGIGAYKIENDNKTSLPLNGTHTGLRVVGSRSHSSPEFTSFMEKLRTMHEQIDIVPAGSSLKFCLVAEGAADIYPRLGPTMEWDTAAGQVILEEAGGRVVEAQSDKPLRYNKPVLKNPDFIASGRSYYDEG